MCRKTSFIPRNINSQTKPHTHTHTKHLTQERTEMAEAQAVTQVYMLTRSHNPCRMQDAPEPNTDGRKEGRTVLFGADKRNKAFEYLLMERYSRIRKIINIT